MVFKIYPFIMCGGAGTRLWPMSTRKQPKQFHKIVSNLSMLQETAKRGEAAEAIDIASPSFVCSSAHKDLVLSQCKDIGIEPHLVILEPMAKNTAAVAATIAVAMADADPEGLVLLLPADHYIGDVPAFWEYIQAGGQSALTGNIVTFGIQPTHPETGYGYIQAGADVGNQSRKIIEFVEKPDLETAQSYLQSGDYYWNAGIFLFKPSVVEAAFADHSADILDAVKVTVEVSKQEESVIYLDGASFDKCRSESFDYAIMEKAPNISLVGPVDIGWNDIGSWRAVWEHEQRMDGVSKSEGYSAETNSCQINSSNILIRSSGTFVATVGVSNLAVICSDESVLVIDLESAQDVKKVVTQLKDAKASGLI